VSRSEWGERALAVTLLATTTADTEIRFGWGALLGASPAMRRLYARFDALTSSACVLVEGESGTGKSALARAFARERGTEPVTISASDDPELDTLESAAPAGVFVVVEDVDLLAVEGQRRLLARLDDAEGGALVATTSRDLDAAVERGVFAEALAARAGLGEGGAAAAP
jgi:DNA-binding NtrC family response regulator